MEKKIKDILEEAVKIGQKKSYARKDSIYSEIERNIAYIDKLRELGWTIKDIAEYLTVNGYHITENTLRKYIYIIKQKEDDDGKNY